MQSSWSPTEVGKSGKKRGIGKMAAEGKCATGGVCPLRRIGLELYTNGKGAIKRGK